MQRPPGERRRAWLAALAVALAAAALYAPTLSHGFALDDAPEIVRNDDIRSLANVPRIFTTGAWAGAGEHNPIYRPLTTVTYALNYAVGELSPLGYHLVNVLLHAGVAALVLALALRVGLGLGAASLAALAFAIHPAHVEVVANVAGRKDALATGFVILAVLAHAAAVRRGGARTVLSPLAIAAALFAKESGAAALGAIAAWDLMLGREEWRPHRRRAVALYGVYALEVVLYLAARRAAVGSFGVPLASIPFVENPIAHAPAAQRLLTAVAVLGRGLALLVLPAKLSPDYSYEAIPVITSVLDPRFLAAVAALAVIAVVAIRARRSWPLLAFATAWYAAAVLPVSNLVVKVGTIFGERLLYLPSVGFCLLLGDVAARALAPGRARAVRVAAACAVAGALSVGTVAYAAVWSDEISLFEAAVRAQPGSAKAHELLGAAFMERERVAEGAAELETALRGVARAPGASAGLRVKLGVAYERLGRVDDAVAQFDQALTEERENPDALWRLGVVRWIQGRRDDATRLWERAVASDPGHARALSELGIAAYQRGDVSAAEALWTRAAASDPHAAGPWLSLGYLYERRGDMSRARDAWLRFLDRARYGAYARQRPIIEERLRAIEPRSAPP